MVDIPTLGVGLREFVGMRDNILTLRGV